MGDVEDLVSDDIDITQDTFAEKTLLPKLDAAFKFDLASELPN